MQQYNSPGTFYQFPLTSLNPTSLSINVNKMQIQEVAKSPSKLPSKKKEELEIAQNFRYHSEYGIPYHGKLRASSTHQPEQHYTDRPPTNQSNQKMMMMTKDSIINQRTNNWLAEQQTNSSSSIANIKKSNTFINNSTANNSNVQSNQGGKSSSFAQLYKETNQLTNKQFQTQIKQKYDLNQVFEQSSQSIQQRQQHNNKRLHLAKSQLAQKLCVYRANMMSSQDQSQQQGKYRTSSIVTPSATTSITTTASSPQSHSIEKKKRGNFIVYSESYQLQSVKPKPSINSETEKKSIISVQSSLGGQAKIKLLRQQSERLIQCQNTLSPNKFNSEQLTSQSPEQKQEDNLHRLISKFKQEDFSNFSCNVNRSSSSRNLDALVSPRLILPKMVNHELQQQEDTQNTEMLRSVKHQSMYGKEFGFGSEETSDQMKLSNFSLPYEGQFRESEQNWDKRKGQQIISSIEKNHKKVIMLNSAAIAAAMVAANAINANNQSKVDLDIQYNTQQQCSSPTYPKKKQKFLIQNSVGLQIPQISKQLSDSMPRPNTAIQVDNVQTRKYHKDLSPQMKKPTRREPEELKGWSIVCTELSDIDK